MRWSAPTYTGDMTAEIAAVRSWCNLTEDNTTDDGMLRDMILAAVGQVERYQRRQLISATFTVTMDDWPRDGCFWFRDHLPITAVSAVKYKESTAGTLTTVTASNYATSFPRSSPGRIVPISSYAWPTLYTDAVDRVQVSLTAGYGSAVNVPMTTRAAIRYLVAQMVEFREPVVLGMTAAEIPQTLKGALDDDCWGWYG